MTFDDAMTLEKRAVLVLQLIDSKIGEESKKSLMEKLERVMMKKDALHSIEQIRLGASSFAIYHRFQPQHAITLWILVEEKNMCI